MLPQLFQRFIAMNSAKPSKVLHRGGMVWFTSKRWKIAHGIMSKKIVCKSDFFFHETVAASPFGGGGSR
jgi:hypothetical protein